MFLFEIGVICLPVGIEEHLRETYLHLKIKIQRDCTVRLNEVYDHHEDTKLFQDKFHNDKKKRSIFRARGKSIFRARTAASSYHIKEIT